MKHILFVIPSMEMGGTRTSLVNLLTNLEDQNDMRIDLLIINHEGELLHQIPKTVNILPEEPFLAYTMPNIRRKTFYSRVYHTLIAFLNRLIGYKRVYAAVFNIFKQRILTTTFKYDAVFAYQEGVSTLIGSLIPANKHFSWIHSDVEKWYDARSFEYEAYLLSDRIIFVAQNTLEIFTRNFPEFSSKCDVIKNTLNIDRIVSGSKNNIEDTSWNFEGLKILSIGRFSKAKAFDRVVKACRFLKDKDIAFKWFIIGDGDLFTSIKSMIDSEKINNELILLGSKSNPFPYISEADLVAVSSTHESQPMIILESLTLSKPIVSTGFDSAREVLKNGEYGYICDNDTESFVNAIYQVISNPQILERLQKKASEYCYNNKEIIKQITSII